MLYADMLIKSIMVSETIRLKITAVNCGHAEHFSDYSCITTMSISQQQLLARVWRARYETRNLAVARVGRPYRLYTKASIRLLVEKRKRFSRVTAVQHVMMTLL